MTTLPDLPSAGPGVLGTMTFGDSVDADGAAEILDAYLNAGGTWVDTANGYAGGRSEEILGTVLNGLRDRIVLATKVGITHPDADGCAPLSRDAINRCLMGSLRRLQTESVDLLYLHQPDRSTPLAETVDTLAELVASGKVQHWGVSNFSAWQIAELRTLADERGLEAPLVSQQVYSLIATRLDDEYAEFAATSGLRTVIYNPLGGGLLTGRHQLKQPPIDGRYGSSPLAQMYRSRYWNDTAFTAVESLRIIAADAGISMVEAALRWTLGRPVVDAVLIGGSRTSNIRDNLSALSRGPLPTQLQRKLDTIPASLRGVMPAYNR